MGKPKLTLVQGGKVDEVDPTAFARKLLVERDGPHCAAWLANKHRRALRRKGYFVTKLPRGASLPMWFSVALETFKKRSSRWEIEEVIRRTATGRTSDRFFVIRYRRHQHFTPAHAFN